MDIFTGQPLSVSYKDKNGEAKTKFNYHKNSSITICQEEGSISNVPGLKITRKLRVWFNKLHLILNQNQNLYLERLPRRAGT